MVAGADMTAFVISVILKTFVLLEVVNNEDI